MSIPKYQRLFEFLKAYYQLQQTTVKDITASKKYLFHLWLSDLETLEEVSHRFLGEKLEEEALLMTIRRPKAPSEPMRPELKEDWKPWLTGDVYDLEASPVLQEAIEIDEEIILLEENAELELQLLDFLSDLTEWKNSYAKYLDLLELFERAQRIYSALFEAANKLESFNERFELLLGVGVFSWKAFSIQRPILTVPLEVDISDTGLIRVFVAVENKLFQIENDFISGLEKLSVASATSKLEEYFDRDNLSVWDVLEKLKTDGLRAFGSRLGANIQYSEVLLPAKGIEPNINFCPVLLFRERSLRSFTALFDSILSHLADQTDGFQLDLLDRIAYELDKLPGNKSPKDQFWKVSDDEILLPKEQNEEQLEIARRISKQDVVLVQGPPGTGKSHSIANIITYLLSQGKKILVTAQTDQALKALKQHLPEEFLDLVIYFLQGDNRKGSDLGKSVRQLQELINLYNPDRIQKQIDDANEVLQKLSKEKTSLLQDIKTLQQADSRRDELNARYKDATLLELTDRVLEDASQYHWMKDEISDLALALQDLPKLLNWYELLQLLEKESYIPGRQIIPDLGKIISPSSLKNLKDQIELYEREYGNLDLSIQEDINPEQLKEVVEEFIAFQEKLQAKQSWIGEVQSAIQNGEILSWKNLLIRTKELLANLENSSFHDLVRNYEVQVPTGISAKQLCSDVAEVLNFVSEGKKLTGVLRAPFLPKTIKNRHYIFKECRINNQLCDTKRELKILADYAHLQLVFTELDELWYPNQREAKDIRRKYEAYKIQCKQLEVQLSHYPTYMGLKERMSKLLQKSQSYLENAEHIFTLQNTAKAYSLKREIDQYKQQVMASLEYLDHISTNESSLLKLRQSIKSLDYLTYLKKYQDYQALTELERKHTELQENESRLLDLFGKTIKELKSTSPSMVLNPLTVEQAIYWSNAKNVLSTRFSDSVDNKFKKLKRNKEEFRAVTLSLLKAKATKRFNEDLGNTEELNRKLTRWTQAVAKSSGMGKLAFQSRILAQKILQQISKDIPCWIMPIYRLVDTLGPKPETFDVVIIDEASQLGPEAMFLKYITKKIIVVGDDQQTAPANVGVQIEKVSALINQYLYDYPDKYFFSTKYSFFDHIAAMAGRRIALREHFRCMPEIIEFSNQLCYRPLGIELIPLKQYSNDRLPPIQKHFVREGVYEKEKNLPEAEAILEKIKSLIKDEAYEDKTFGIIVLQGNHQVVEIDKRLRNEIPPFEFKKRKIVVGKPSDFQGDERDVIFLSLVTALNHRRRSLTTDTSKRSFNVAMSRAKEQVWLFHSVQEEDLKPKDLRFQLLHYFNTKKLGKPNFNLEFDEDRSQKAPKPFESWFEVDIYKELLQKGYEVEPQVKVGPYRIDLVVHLPNGKKIAIECDGDIYHDLENLQQDIDRQLVLERSGWEFFRIRWSYYKYEPKQALKKLWILLQKRGEASFPPGHISGLKSQSNGKIPHQNLLPSLEKLNHKSTNKANEEIVKEHKYDILIFTNRRLVYIYHDLPKAKAERIQFQGKPETKEKQKYKLITPSYKGFLIFGYKNGKVDKVSLSAFKTTRSLLRNAYHKNQKLIFIRHFDQETDLIGITKENKVVVFSTEIITEHSSRANQGNQVFISGSKVQTYNLLSETKIRNPDYYRRTTTNSKGYYLKEGDRV